MRRVLTAAAVASFVVGASGPAIADGDTLRIAHYDLPAQRGMPYGTFGANGALVLMAAYDSLTYVDRTGTPGPGLALSWELKGETTWIVKLRPGVKYHNGQPFNADVVVANIDALTNDETVSKQQVAGQLRGIPSARAIDDLTVEITTSVPEPILPSRLAIMRPHEPKAWADLGAEGYGTNPVGTGPYRISIWDNEKIRGTAFEEGWRVPKIKNLVVDLLPENAARRQALCSNQTDIANVLTPDDKGPIESCGHKIVLSPTNNTVNLILRHLVKDSPVSDVRVRQALNYAYDKEGFTQNVLAGVTRPAAMPATSTMSGWFEDIRPYPYNPAKAKQLLAEAGYPNGFDMLAEIVVTTGEFADTFQAMSNDLRAVGVNLELRVITIPDLIQKILRRKPWEGDAFSMMYEGYPTADISRNMNTHSCLVTLRRDRDPHTCFPEITDTILEMEREFDPAKRSALQRKVAQFYHDQATAIYSHERVQVDGVAGNLMNYSVVNRTIPYHALEFVN